MKIELDPIGYISSPYKSREDIPRQSVHVKDKEATIKINDEYKDGLLGIEAGDYIIIIFYFHKVKETFLQVKPCKSKELKGVFSTRAPVRPNQLGLTIAKVIEVSDGKIKFDGVDMLDGTPVIDIKPYSEGLNPNK